MAYYARRKVLLAKTETTYGLDPTPTGVANAILVRNLSVDPISNTNVSRDLVRPYFGNFAQLIANTLVSVDFEVELAGSGTAGTAPAYGPILKACGLTETIVPATSVTYSPVSASFSSVTFYINVDGVNHVVTGARGSYTLSLPNNQIPTIQFKFEGIYNEPTNVATPSATYTQIVPKLVNATNTTGLQLHSYSGGVCGNINIVANNSIELRDRIGGYKAIEMTDRRMNGSITLDAVPFATKNYFQAATNTTSGNLAVTHGTTAGNLIGIACNDVTVSGINYGEDAGILTLDMDLAINPSSGNDEIYLVFT